MPYGKKLKEFSLHGTPIITTDDFSFTTEGHKSTYLKALEGLRVLKVDISENEKNFTLHFDNGTEITFHGE